MVSWFSKPAVKVVGIIFGTVILAVCLVFAGQALGNLMISPVPQPVPTVTVTGPPPTPTREAIDRGETDELGQAFPNAVLQYALTDFENRSADDAAQYVSLDSQKVTSTVSATYSGVLSGAEVNHRVLAVQFQTVADAQAAVSAVPAPDAEPVEDGKVQTGNTDVGQFIFYDLVGTDGQDSEDPNSNGMAVWSNGTTVLWVTGPLHGIADFYTAFPL